jgi:hypothetical protein
MPEWLLLHYNVAAKPSARRVYIWRKLKHLGAILLQNAVWVLPETPRTEEHFRWLATEIHEMEGEALVWRSHLVLGLQEEVLVQRFLAQVDGDYARILKNLERRNAELSKLSRLYQQIHARDYFGSRLGRQVRDTLLAARNTAE